KVYVVRAKEVTGWVPDFGEENSDESKDYSDNNSVGKKNWVESKEGKVYVVRAKEVTGWVPDFGEENSDESKDYSDNNSVGKKNWVESEEGEIIPESVQNDAFIDNIAESEPINVDSCKNQPDHYEYEKVEALRERTTPQDSKKETKTVSLDVFVVKNLWGNMLFDFATSLARGRSGGILCVWDKLLFYKKRTYSTERCLCVEGNDLPGDLTKRANLFCDLKDIDHKDSIDLAQKAKIKWVIEGDENSKIFHGIVNKKRRHLPLKDIVSNEEIKRAVWDCGSDKSPWPIC
nr:RNA-directed DNA polymerase, eukaryota, reverse transcriptase zinc-binding domain protein [Tanacetum cinerariifolium]